MQTQLIIWMQHLFSDDCQATERALSQQTPLSQQNYGVCTYIYRIILD